MEKIYKPGAVGALLDLYEEAIFNLKNEIKTIPDQALIIIIDHQTTNENCRSFQTILSHVVYSGYGYATSIHNLKGNNIVRPNKTLHATVDLYLKDLDDVFIYTVNVFKTISDDELEQLDNSLKIKTGWSQLYDIEQMMEHAIVHIIRHQRQIAKFKNKDFWQ